MKVSLAKALRLRKELVGRIAHTQRIIAANNSTTDIAPKVHDIPALLILVQRKLAELSMLTASLQKANEKVLYDITHLAQLKGMIVVLKNMDVFAGKKDVAVGYGSASKEVTYVAQVSETKRDEMVTRLQDEISATQDRLDAHNATNHIDVPDDLLKF